MYMCCEDLHCMSGHYLVKILTALRARPVAELASLENLPLVDTLVSLKTRSKSTGFLSLFSSLLPLFG